MKKFSLWKRFFGSDKPNTQKRRNLKVETLEERQLLSVSPDYGWYTTNPDATVFEIDTAGELVALANLVNGLDEQTAVNFSGKTIQMTGDIDLSDVGAGEWNPIGTDSHFFTGNFDGQNHSITNLNITEFKTGSYWVNAGLFGWVRGDNANNSSIKNVNLSGNISIEWNDPNFTPATGEGFGNGYVGLLVAEGAGYGSIENCSVNGAIHLKYTGTEIDKVDFQVGGVVGDLWTSNMSNVSSSVKITIETANNARKVNVGGLIGISVGDGVYGWGNINTSSYNGSKTESYDIHATNGGNVNGGGVCGLTMNVNSDISDRLTVNDANLYLESTTSYVQAGGLYGAKNGGAGETSPIGQVTNCIVNADVTARASKSYAIAGGLIGGVSGAKSGNIANNTFAGNVDVKTTGTGGIKVYTGGMIGIVWNNVAGEGNGIAIVDNYIGEGTTVKADSTGATGFTNIGGIIGNIEHTNIKVIQNNATIFPAITVTGPAITQGLVVGMTKGTTELLIDQDMVDDSDFALVGNSTDTVTYILGEDITFAEGKKLQITTNQKFVLDLNGFKLSGASDCVIENNGNLTITDSSVDKSGCVENTATTDAVYAISNNDNGKIVIQAGKFIGKNNGQTAEALKLTGSSSTALAGGSYSSTDSNAYYTKGETATITYNGYSAVPVTGTTGNEIRIESAKIRITSGSSGVTTASTLADALLNAQSDSTIVLTEGVYEITPDARSIDKNLTIIGEGKVVIKFATSETQASTFFEINDTATISFENVIFTGATKGLFFNKGALTLKRCAVVNNSGKLFDVTSGSLQMSNTIFANNNSECLIDNTGGNSICTIVNCTFVKNNATDDDGLITLNSQLNVTWNNVLVDNCIKNEPAQSPISWSTVGHGSYMDYTRPEFFEGGYPSDDEGWINWDGKLAKTASDLINRGIEDDSVKAILGVVDDNWNPVTDYAGNSRKSGDSIDIGAYELDYVNTPEFNSEDSLSTSEVKLTWGANNAVDFNLYISSAKDGAYTLVDDDKLVISGYSAIVSGLNTNTQYWFKLEAINSEGTTSKLSDPYFAYPLAAKPVNLQANATAANTITVTFDDGEPAHPALGYLLYQKTADSEYVIINDNSNVVRNGTTFTISGLTGGTTYTYKLSAMNARGRENFAETTASATAYTNFPHSTTFVPISSDVTSQSFKVNLTNILQANNVDGTYTVSVYSDENFSESSFVETKTLDQTADNTDPVVLQFANGLTADTTYYIKASVWGKVSGVPTYFAQDNTLQIRTNKVMTDATIGYNDVYDAAGHGITVTVTGPSAFDVKYKDSDGNYTLDDCPQYTNAGNYTISYLVTATGYDNVEGTQYIDISEVHLTVTGTNVQIEKIYDTNVNATVLNPGTPSPIKGDDASKVTFATIASYDTANVGTGKTIRVHYTLTDKTEGANVAVNYILPVDYTYSTDGVITVEKLDTPNVTVGTLNATSLDLSWAIIADADSYTVECWNGTTKVDASITIDEGMENVTASVSGLTANTLYTFQVKANPATGDVNREASDWGIKNTYTLAAVPTNVTAAGTSTSSITVSWDATDAAAFKVYMSQTGEEGSYTLVESNITFETTSAVITQLSANTRYWFKVSAVNSATPGVESALSNAADIYTQAAVPTSLESSEIHYNSAKLGWDANNATSYAVYVSTTGVTPDSSYSRVAASNLTFDGTTVLVDGLTALTGYWFKVSAFNANGTETEMSEYTFVQTPIAAPVCRQLEATVNSIAVEWDPITGATGYEAQYMMLNSTDGWTDLDVTDCAVLASGLVSDTIYQFRSRVINGEIFSEWSVILPVSTLKEIPLPQEEPETASVSSSEVNVSWTPVASDQAAFVDGYKINVFQKDGTFVKTVNVDGAETDSAVIEGLETGTEYDFVIYTEPSQQGEEIENYGETLVGEVSGSTQSDNVSWDLAGLDYNDLTLTASVDDAGVYTVSLYANGVSTPIKSVVNVVPDATVTILGNSAIAEQLHISENAMSLLGNIIFQGGSGKRDSVIIDGINNIEDGDLFTIDTEESIVTTQVYTVNPFANLLDYYKNYYGENSSIYKNFEKIYNDAYSRLQKIVHTSQVRFNTVALEDDANVKLAGVGSVTIEAGQGDDRFKINDLGVTYALNGGDGNDTLDFSDADTRVVIDMGRTNDQCVLPGDIGRVRLQGDIEGVTGSSKSDHIVSAANTQTINGNGGSDLIILNGVVGTQTEVELDGRSQSVLVRGDGQYKVTIDNADYSVVNALAASEQASLNVEVSGRNTRIYGTRGADSVEVFGDYAYVNTGSGSDKIYITGSNARVLAGNGDDTIIFRSTPTGEICSEDNYVYGEGGNDLIIANNTKGKNFFYAGTGNDMVIGGVGNDYIYGTSGNNVLIGNLGVDRVFGGAGQDLLLASSTKKINDTIGDPEKRDQLFTDLYSAWCDGDPDTDAVIELIGTESVSDTAKDWIYRGSGYSNMLYINSETDIDFGNALVFDPFNDYLFDE